MFSASECPFSLSISYAYLAVRYMMGSSMVDAFFLFPYIFCTLIPYSGTCCVAPIICVCTRWCTSVFKHIVPHERLYWHACEYCLVCRHDLHPTWSSLPRGRSSYQCRLRTIRDRALRCIFHPDRSEVRLQKQLQAWSVQSRNIRQFLPRYTEIEADGTLYRVFPSPSFLSPSWHSWTSSSFSLRCHRRARRT